MRGGDEDPFAEFDGRAPRGRERSADVGADSFPGLFTMSRGARDGVGRRLASVSQGWANGDTRRNWVRLALMIYLFISIFVLMTILRGNRRMPLLSSGSVFCA